MTMMLVEVIKTIFGILACIVGMIMLIGLVVVMGCLLTGELEDEDDGEGNLWNNSDDTK